MLLCTLSASSKIYPNIKATNVRSVFISCFSVLITPSSDTPEFVVILCF